jgi:hypothetical protein
MRNALLFAACLAAGLAGATAADPDPQALALAKRYMAATGGTYEVIEEQAYAAAGVMGDSATSHARQTALQEAATEHRADLAAVDDKLAAVMAGTYTPAELGAAVRFLESPQGRAIADKKHAYYAAMYDRARAPLVYSPDETAALAAYDALPEAQSMNAKTPLVLNQTMALLVPVQKAIRLSAYAVYCHETRRCEHIGDNYDPIAGPSIPDR